MIDTKLEEHIRDLQADLIRKTKRNVTFSEVVNDTLRKGLDG